MHRHPRGLLCSHHSHSPSIKKEIVIKQQILDRQVNPADETIRLGGLAMRFLLTGSDTNGSLASAELTVAGRQKLPAPAHSHSHYEESIYGLEGVMVWTGCSAYRAAPFTSLRTGETRMERHCA
jgi:quercetin dioxygenase-like cupin family protein